MRRRREAIPGKVSFKKTQGLEWFACNQNYDLMVNTILGYLTIILISPRLEVDYGEYLSNNEKTQR